MTPATTVAPAGPTDALAGADRPPTTEHRLGAGLRRGDSADRRLMWVALHRVGYPFEPPQAEYNTSTRLWS
jgi:hypothetical protein